MKIPKMQECFNARIFEILAQKMLTVDAFSNYTFSTFN